MAQQPDSLRLYQERRRTEGKVHGDAYRAREADLMQRLKQLHPGFPLFAKPELHGYLVDIDQLENYLQDQANSSGEES